MQKQKFKIHNIKKQNKKKNTTQKVIKERTINKLGAVLSSHWEILYMF